MLWAAQIAAIYAGGKFALLSFAIVCAMIFGDWVAYGGEQHGYAH
jgi:hypothetical protein